MAGFKHCYKSLATLKMGDPMFEALVQKELARLRSQFGLPDPSPAAKAAPPMPAASVSAADRYNVMSSASAREFGAAAAVDMSLWLFNRDTSLKRARSPISNDLQRSQVLRAITTACPEEDCHMMLTAGRSCPAVQTALICPLQRRPRPPVTTPR